MIPSPEVLDGRLLRSRVLLYQGSGFVSSLIRWQTRCAYTHAAILRPDGQVLEAREFAGVQLVPYAVRPGEIVDHFRVAGLTAQQWREVLDFGERRLGRGYDYLGVLRFLSRRSGGNPDRWFCSELVFAALETAGLPVLSRIHAVEVSPALLARSPLLIWERSDGREPGANHGQPSSSASASDSDSTGRAARGMAPGVDAGGAVGQRGACRATEAIN